MAKNLFRSERDRTLTYQRVFSGPDGQKVLVDLYVRYMASDPIGQDQMQTNILVGKQAVVREIMRTLGADHLELEEESHGSSGPGWEPIPDTH